MQVKNSPTVNGRGEQITKCLQQTQSERQAGSCEPCRGADRNQQIHLFGSVISRRGNIIFINWNGDI